MADVRDARPGLDPVDAWLEAAAADADRRGLPDLRPLLETLAQSTRRLRAAGWNSHVPADGRPGAADGGPASGGRQETTR